MSDSEGKAQQSREHWIELSAFTPHELMRLLAQRALYKKGVYAEDDPYEADSDATDPQPRAR